MSPSLLTRLRRAERIAQRWATNESLYWLRLGLPASARWYGNRRYVWPDARTLVTQNIESML